MQKGKNIKCIQNSLKEAGDGKMVCITGKIIITGIKFITQITQKREICKVFYGYLLKRGKNKEKYVLFIILS